MNTYGIKMFPDAADTTQSISRPKLLLPLLIATPILLTGYVSNNAISVSGHAQTPSSIRPTFYDVGLQFHTRYLSEPERQAIWRALHSSVEIISRGRLIG